LTDLPTVEPGVADQPYAWLTTTGRTSGKPRTVELWFVLEGRTIHILAGGGTGAHWVRNAQADPAVAIRLGQRTYAGRARWPERSGSEDERARRRIATKYQGWHEGRPLSGWARESLCVAFDLDPEP
jgi:deazaflavin-dependent oxidoreductase (nitroreductase family)